MKQVIFYIYTFFFKLLNPTVSAKKSMFALVDFKIANGNSVSFDGACVDKTTVRVYGKNNVFQCSSQLHKNNIRIVGDNNTVRIVDSVINSAEIVVRGNGCSIIIENNTTMGSGCIICMGKDNTIRIGQNSMLADNVEIWSTDAHGIFDSDGNMINPSKPVIIGEHVWLGKYAKVMKGVTIGDGAIVGMNSMVTKDIRPNTLNVGIPSREIRENVSWSARFISRIETGEETFAH